MMRTAIVGAAVVAALTMSRAIGVAEATVLPPSSRAVSLPVGPRDECQECETGKGQFSTGAWSAWWEYFANEDGQCDPGFYSCVRCNGEPFGCPGQSDGGIFEDSESADTWLDTSNNCGNCGGDGLEELLTATSLRDAGTLATRIASSEGAVWLNLERGALQARGCGKTVGFHVAIDGALMAEVTAALEQLGN